MPIFIICCLLLGFLVKSQSLYLSILISQPVWIAASCLAVGCLLAGCLKKRASPVWHDGFASAVLWAWYGNWQPLFASDVPMFYAFPIYYALLAGWMTLAVINNSARFDQASRESLHYLQHNLARFSTCAIACLVLASLVMPDYYLLYPISMTLFIIRYTLQRSLEIVESQ